MLCIPISFESLIFQVTPLAIALMKDQIPCADYLLSLENVDVNFPDDCGRTLLCQKLRCSTLNEALLQKITFLVEKKGADVNKADIEQWTPVGYRFVAKVLLVLKGFKELFSKMRYLKLLR